MTSRSALLAVLFAAFLAVPAASAAADRTVLAALQAPDEGQARCLSGAADAADGAAPPCGYIVPQILLEFPDKPLCRAETLGGPIALEGCLQLPADGGSVVQNGVMRFTWDITQDGTYPADPAQPIVVSFTGTASNPDWMDMAIEPATVQLDAVALANPANTRQDVETQQVHFWFEQPLTVTFTRSGWPDPASLEKMERQQGVAQLFLKAKSTASGAYFREAFGVEEFRFSSCSAEAGLAGDVAACGAASGPANDAPGAGLPAALGALAGLAVLLRRRAA